MSWLVGVSLRFRMLVLAGAAGILVLGITQLPAMPVDVLPEFGPTSVEVQTEALGLSAQEVEQLITVPLEQDLLNGVPWLDEIRSESMPGLSTVVMRFQPGVDTLRARQVVGERMTQAFALPHVSRPPTMLQPTSAANRVMMVGLLSRDLSLIDLSVLARWTIAPRLMGVPGVANVSIWGQRDRQLQVLVDPKRLLAKNVTLLQVLETTGNAMWVSSLSFVEASTPGTGGFIETANQRLGIRHVFPISSPEGLAQVPVEGKGTLRLGDVATVVEDHQPLIGDAVGPGPGLLLVVEKSPSANTLEVTASLDKAIAAMRPGLSGVDIDASVYRADTFLESAIGNIGVAVLVGGLLLIVVVVAQARNWRAALISAIAIAVSLVVAALVLYFRGAPVNTMVLAGFLMALGLVIDDAITGGDEAVRSASLYALLVVALAVVPAWLIGGLVGALLQPLIISYALALVASMLTALLITPGLSLVLLSATPTARAPGAVMQRLQRGYERALAAFVKTPGLPVAVLVVWAAGGMATLPFTHQALVPVFMEPDLLVHVNGPPGTSRSEMDRVVARMRDELQGVAGVRNVGAHVGRALLSDRAVNVNSAELWVSVDATAPYDSTVANVRHVIDGYPGLQRQVTTYLQDRTKGYQRDDSGLTVRVFGEDPDVLRRTADEVRRAVAGVEGVVNQRIDLPLLQPTLEVELNLTAAQRYGLKPGDVRRAAAIVLSGIQAGSLFEEQKVFDVVVWGIPETRTSISTIRDLLLDTPSGGHVRLGDVAQVRLVPELSVIRHQDVRGYLDIRMNLSGRDAGDVARDVEHTIQTLQFPLEYHAEVLGDFARLQAERSRVLAIAVAAALGMLLVLQAAFNSWRLAAGGLVLLASALSGGLLVVTLFEGGTLTIGGLAGLMAVFGIAVRQLIVVVRNCQRGTAKRLAPVLTVALGTAAAMLAFLVGVDRPGFEVARPLAMVVVGGLITATLLNLFVAPALYLLLGARGTAEEAAMPARPTPVSAVPAAPLVSIMSVALILVSGCGSATTVKGVKQPVAEPARLEHVAGTELNRVILTDQAAARLDVQTAQVQEAVVNGAQHLVIPYAAVIYDVEGEAWAYTNPERLTFVRHKLEVDSIEGDVAVLSDGPPVGTAVVTVGGAELYGAEFEFQEG